MWAVSMPGVGPVMAPDAGTRLAGSESLFSLFSDSASSGGTGMRKERKLGMVVAVDSQVYVELGGAANKAVAGCEKRVTVLGSACLI